MGGAGRWGWALVAAGALAGGCGTKDDTSALRDGTPSAQAPRETPDAGPGTTPDAGPPDAGPPDAGPQGPVVHPLTLPTLQGWEFFGPEQGGPLRVHGASADEGGNIWVAGGEEGLFLLEPGATRLRRFTAADGLTPYVDADGVHTQPVISVAGARTGSVIVGYQGVGTGDSDPPAMLQSGDADRVTLTASGLRVSHFDIMSTGQEMGSKYPDGRQKIRTVHRIVFNHRTGDIWFGGDHGVAFWDQVRKDQGATDDAALFEHAHAAINGYIEIGKKPDGSPLYDFTLLSGDWWGLALSPTGDVWMGGDHRIGKQPFASSRHFEENPDGIDVWPDAAREPYPDQRVDDAVMDLIALDDSVWVGSFNHGLANVGPSGTTFFEPGKMVNEQVTSLERDPANGSLWVGHFWGGLSRIDGGNAQKLSYGVFGRPLADTPVRDIQSATIEGKRRILVSFNGHTLEDGSIVPGALGIYSGD